jgi:hypothetical protein
MVAAEGVIAIETMVALVTVNGTELVNDHRVDVRVIEPGAKPTRRPVLGLTWATEGSEQDQVTRLVILRVLPSLNIPVATRRVFVPCAVLPFAGVIEIELRFAALTLRGVLPVTDPRVAEIVVLPMFRAVARPLAVIEATEPAEECQVATPVTVWLVPSENVAVARNCWVIPSGRATPDGVTTIELTEAEVTTSDAVAESDPIVAEMVELPAAMPWASPLVGVELLTVASTVLEDVQVTELVRFCVLPSLYVPVATNCWVVPGAIEAFTGVIETDTKAGATARLKEPLTAPIFAPTEHDPAFFAVSNPPAATVTTLVSEELHVAEAVTSCKLPLL